MNDGVLVSIWTHWNLDQVKAQYRFHNGTCVLLDVLVKDSMHSFHMVSHEIRLVF